jgi:hypothetical protein
VTKTIGGKAKRLKRQARLILRGLSCSHRRMRYCCHPRDCGHLHCHDCGLFWDEGSDGGPPPWPRRPAIDAAELLQARVVPD